MELDERLNGKIITEIIIFYIQQLFQSQIAISFAVSN